MAQQGIFYHGLSILGGGSILAGVILGSIAVFIIERKFVNAAAFSFAGAVLTFFGLMHGEAIGIGQTPNVAITYLLVGLILFGCAKFATFSAAVPEHEAEEEHAEDAEEGFEGEPALT